MINQHESVQRVRLGGAGEGRLQIAQDGIPGQKRWVLEQAAPPPVTWGS